MAPKLPNYRIDKAIRAACEEQDRVWPGRTAVQEWENIDDTNKEKWRRTFKKGFDVMWDETLHHG